MHISTPPMVERAVANQVGGYGRAECDRYGHSHGAWLAKARDETTIPLCIVRWISVGDLKIFIFFGYLSHVYSVE